ncbi:MAG: hypothetical protein RLZZ618_2515 [Pseudomonadota bacterium]|jgi:uncharacterized membrane protein (UPF0127 family)
MMTTSIRALPALLALLALSVSGLAAAQEGPQTLPAIKLGAGIHKIQAMVARTPAEHTIGLMHRATMATNDGMLFIFDQPTTQCFWMKNTLLPLSAAFVADDGTVVNIEDMAPKTLDPHCSKKPVRYVLEMNKGWFAQRGIKSGYRLKGEPFGK